LDSGKDYVMATAYRTLGDSGNRMAPAMGAMPYARARAQTIREATPRQNVRALMLGMNDAALATFGHDCMAVDCAGRNGFPL